MAQKAIDIEKFKNILIPIPPLSKQKEIIEYCENINKEIENIKKIKENKSKFIIKGFNVVNINIKLDSIKSNLIESDKIYNNILNDIDRSSFYTNIINKIIK